MSFTVAVVLTRHMTQAIRATVKDTNTRAEIEVSVFFLTSRAL